MTPVSKYFYSNSPFIPLYDMDSLVEESMRIISNGHNPTIAVCTTLSTMMDFHLKRNLYPDLNNLNSKFGTSLKDLILLKYGYELPFDTLFVTIVYLGTNSKNKALDQLIQSVPNEFVKSYRQYLYNILDITRDLLQKDITGQMVLRFLIERPFIRGDYFDTGHEFADYVFEETCLAVALKIVSE